MSLLLALQTSPGATGTLAFTTGGIQFAGVGVETITGTAAFTTGSITFAGVGVETITGTAAFTTGSITFAGVGVETETGTLAFTTDGVIFSAEAQVAAPATAQTPAGVRFTPIRVGEAVAKAAKLEVSYGQATAEGVDGRIAGSVHARGVSAPIGFALASAAGEARVTARSAGIATSVGAAKISAAAACRARPAALRVYYGGSVVTAAGSFRAAPVLLPVSHAPASARGILNPSEEELIMIYLKRRNSKRLQKR